MSAAPHSEGGEHARREAKAHRRELVHAAGCVFRGSATENPCATIGAVPELLGAYLAWCRIAKLRPRIPRSLRHIEPAEEIP